MIPSWPTRYANLTPRLSRSRVYDGKVAPRPAIVNWRTTATDVDAFVAVVRELL
jgi:hypothetical protein